MPGLRTLERKMVGIVSIVSFFCKGDEGLGKLVNSPLTRFK